MHILLTSHSHKHVFSFLPMKSSKKKRVSFDLSGLSPNDGVEDEDTSSGESEVGNEDSDSTEERDYEVNDTRQLVLQHNRKKKKSGGFQSMGETLVALFVRFQCIAVRSE